VDIVYGEKMKPRGIELFYFNPSNEKQRRESWDKHGER